VGVGIRSRRRSRGLEGLAHAQQVTRDCDFDVIRKRFGGNLNVSQLAIKTRKFAAQVHNSQLRICAATITEKTLGHRDQIPPNALTLKIWLDGKHSDASDSGSDLSSHLAEHCALKGAICFQQEECSATKGRLDLSESDSFVDQEKALHRKGTVDQRCQGGGVGAGGRTQARLKTMCRFCVVRRHSAILFRPGHKPAIGGFQHIPP
jgi:hypothetical protein